MWISAVGLACPVGLNAKSASLAMRGGISQLDELTYIDNNGEPIIGSAIACFPSDIRYVERLIELLCVAVNDCISQLSEKVPKKINVIIGLANPDRPGSGATYAKRISDTVIQLMSQRFSIHRYKVEVGGATSSYRALRLVKEGFDSGKFEHCVVCSVDSLINASTLSWLSGTDRLKTQDNHDGVIPGEAAACIYFTKERPARGSDNKPATKVVGIGFGHEDAHVLTDKPLLGLGIVQAAKESLEIATLGFEDLDFKISDCSGESFGFREQSLLTSRLLRKRKSTFPIWHAAEYMGSTGAAAGLCQLIQFEDAVANGYSDGRRAISCTADDFGARAAVILEAG